MIRLVLLLLLVSVEARAAEVQVLTAGAYRHALDVLAPGFEAQTGHQLIIRDATAGVVQGRVRAGDAVDFIVLPPAGIAALGELIMPGTVRPLAKVGIGVAVRAGAPRPDVSTAAAFRAAVLGARAPAWIDPASGGSSGIYVAGLFQQWGIADQLATKAVLVKGGLVADKLLNGEADLALQQMSELVGVPGVTLVGPLPADIQMYTVYAGAIPAKSGQVVPARLLLEYLSGPGARAVLPERGMAAP